MNPIPIVLDTDIGDDIDDALALAIILNSGELDLCGVTTVFRDAPRRAVMARHLLDLWDRPDIPVAAGCSKPLLEPYTPELGGQMQYLAKNGLDTGSIDGGPHGVDLLLASAADETDPITIVPIGPLTNIALALAKDESLASRCEIVLMGGMWNRQLPNYIPEWNIRCDPEAAAMVFNSGARIKMIGLDVTLQCQLTNHHVDQIAAHGTERSRVLSELIELWMREYKKPPILHDPLAILTLFSDHVQFEEKAIDVVLCGPERGTTPEVEGGANIQVAVSVDAPRAIEDFMERLLR